MTHIPCTICGHCVSEHERIDLAVNGEAKAVCHECCELIRKEKTMTTQQDNRTVADCTITWDEDPKSGRTYYFAKFDDGGECQLWGDWEPIKAGTDSWDVAELMASELSLEVLSVEHDGEYIHATMRQR